MPVPILTYYDALAWASDFVSGSGTSSMAQRDLRRAIQVAQRKFCSVYDWAFLKRQGRVQLQAVQSTGTVVYDHTGGTYERQLTLTGATWPTWVEDAVVKLGGANYICHVDDYKSTTVITLDSVLNPGQDVASTTYTCYPLYYHLPADFESLEEVWGQESWRLGREMPLDTILALHRYESDSGDLDYYAIAEVADLLGTMGLYLYPPIDAAETLDFTYKRRARDLRYTGHDTAESQGTISVSVANTTMTGVGTAFDLAMIGSVVRIGTSSSNVPTGLEGLYPYSEERVITAVASATSATLDSMPGRGRSGVKYTITDPIDLPPVAHNAFLWCVANEIAGSRIMKNSGEVAARYREALLETRAADNRVTGIRVVGAAAPILHQYSDVAVTDDE